MFVVLALASADATASASETLDEWLADGGGTDLAGRRTGRHTLARASHHAAAASAAAAADTRAARSTPEHARPLAGSHNASGSSPLALLEPDAHMKDVVFSAAAARADSRKILVPLFSNAGFGPFLRNVICSFVRVQVTNWMVIAMDNATCAQLDGAGIPLDEHACAFPYARRALTTGGLATYRSLEFNRIVMQRPMWMYHLLLRGYSVLQCDLDVVWIRSPLPLFERPGRAAEADMLFQSEGGHGYNGGFYFARPTGGTKALLRAWLANLAASAGSRGFEEQHSLGRVLAGARRAGTTKFIKLNETEAPNGKMWWNALVASKAGAHIVHCNWVKLMKKTRLRRDNLWFLDEDDRRCAAGFDPLERGCSHYCVPVTYCAPGKACTYEKDCAKMRKLRLRGLRGQEGWHPMAFERANCSAAGPRSTGSR